VGLRVKDALRFGCVTCLLLVSTTGLRLVPRGHPVPLRSDFESFPYEVGNWSGTDLPDLDSKTKDALRADNYLLRRYSNHVVQTDLLAAYYKSQESGDTIHDPRNCYPGAGWEQVSLSVVQIPNPEIPEGSFPVNHFVVEKDGVKQDVLYWYQGHGRAYASPYLGKIYLVWDGIRKGRTDGALIRLSAVRASENDQPFPAMAGFAQDLSSVLPQFLPN
jgi:EpsI family protein